jgi:hypothetical protein
MNRHVRPTCIGISRASARVLGIFQLLATSVRPLTTGSGGTGELLLDHDQHVDGTAGFKVPLKAQPGRFIDVGEETVERLSLRMNPVIDAESALHAVLILRHSDLHQHA